MLGKQAGTLLDVREVDIHGALFYDVTFALDSAPLRASTSRIGRESVYENPQSGDAVTLHLLMGQITGIEKRAS
jgi:hypothetical protein